MAIIPETLLTPPFDFSPDAERPTSLDTSFSPEQRLAWAVLRQARADLLSWDAAVRADARQFFCATNPIFVFWCDVLDVVDVAAVLRYAEAAGASATLTVQLSLFVMEG